MYFQEVAVTTMSSSIDLVTCKLFGANIDSMSQRGAQPGQLLLVPHAGQW